MYDVKDNPIPLADKMLDLGCDINARNKVILFIDSLYKSILKYFVFSYLLTPFERS